MRWSWRFLIAAPLVFWLAGLAAIIVAATTQPNDSPRVATVFVESAPSPLGQIAVIDAAESLLASVHPRCLVGLGAWGDDGGHWLAVTTICDDAPDGEWIVQLGPLDEWLVMIPPACWGGVAMVRDPGWGDAILTARSCVEAIG